MTSPEHTPALLTAAGTAAALTSPAAPTTPGSVADLIARIKNPDETIYGPAWQTAEQYGSATVEPLAALMADADFELARRAKRALYRVVRHAGRPGAAKEAQLVEARLLRVLKRPESSTRREALWMLSEIASDKAVAPMAALLKDPETAEAARCALLRLPGGKATAALKAAFASAPEPFKYALADSLRRRREEVAGYPSQKMVPHAQTTVVPYQPPTPAAATGKKS